MRYKCVPFPIVLEICHDVKHFLRLDYGGCNVGRGMDESATIERKTIGSYDSTTHAWAWIRVDVKTVKIAFVVSP